MSRHGSVAYYQLATGLCLLSIPALSALAYQSTDGGILNITNSYTSSGPGDYPLYTSGVLSKIETGAEGLMFTSSNNATGVAVIENGGELNLSKATLTSSGSVADTVNIDGGTLHASQGSINATGKVSWGIVGNNSSLLDLQGTTVNVSGSADGGIMLGSRSQLTAQNTQIIASDNAIALSLKSGNLADRSSAVITDSTLSAENADGIRIMNGDVELNNTVVSSAGTYTYAINANTGAKVSINGGHLQTTGDFGDAVWIASEDSSLTAKDATFTTFGDGAFAVNAQNGMATLNHSLLETSGSEAHGLYGERNIQGDQLTITTAGDWAIGVFSARGGEITLTDSSVTTKGQGSAALLAYPESSINGDNVKITTSGDNAWAIATTNSNVTLSKAEITTAGKGGAIYATGNISSQPNNISLNTAHVLAQQGAVITSDGALLNVALTKTALESDSGEVLNALSNQSNPASPILSNVTLKASDNSVLNGSLISDSDANASRVYLSLNSSLKGFSQNISELTLDNTSQWQMTASSDVGALTNDGTITFAPPENASLKTASLKTLTIKGDYLSNGGHLLMNTALGDDTSATDKLIVEGDVQAGDTQVTINNIGGQGAQTVEGIEVVKVGGTSHGTFTSTGRIVAGIYDYSLVKKSENWYLTSQVPTVVPLPGENDGSNSGNGNSRITPVYRPESGALLANKMAGNTLFNTNLYDRMGETGFSPRNADSDSANGFWLRQVGGHTRFNDGSNQLKTRINRYVVQLGQDFVDWSSNGQDRWHIGPMVGYGNAQSNSHSKITGYRADGKVDGYSAGLYATWFASEKEKNGTYLDSWVLYNWFNNQIDGQELPSEDYHSQGFTASLEGGYKMPMTESMRLSSWLQPKFQLIWMDVNANSHRESNGTQISEQMSGNLMSRVGVRASLKGHNAIDDNTGREFQPFVEANWVHNTNDYKVKMDDVSNTVAGTENMAEFKAGVEGKVHNDFNLWGNVTVLVGDKDFSDTSVLFGGRYNF
ncbi:autotransporter outer membrane beta-barrel domain-containing protein [Enterobacter sp. CC120223-11]|uniref:autotransporter outer membrane beta-barrel domain-containing protein n=1 Tax=Enterobacter sp. CC120223-11 TaxID=1378073 RepID=UPI000BC3D0FB|nr:autotransporter outer membrane beta-barrel domain-containing protein [Enterobacter sp. CC120223-11]SNY61414.1 autotransporter family porin [Enterobacter sp. CC120223-11]